MGKQNAGPAIAAPASFEIEGDGEAAGCLLDHLISGFKQLVDDGRLRA
jgi:hypothetical protein